MNGQDDIFASSVASARVKAKKKRPYLQCSQFGNFLEQIDTARGFSGEFKKNLKGQLIGKLMGFLGI